MANVYGTPVLFTKQNNTWILEAKVNFGVAGSTSAAANLDGTFSKGFISINPESVAFTASVTNSVTYIGSVSSYAGLFAGMTVTGSAGALQTVTKIDNVNSNLSVNFTGQSIPTSDLVNMLASGGRYRIQLGTNQLLQTGLTPYVKLLYAQVIWDESTSSSIGTASAIALAPSAPGMFIVDDKVSRRTVPPTAATNSADCSIAVQFGYTTSSGVGLAITNRFQAANPTAGESCKIIFVLSNSTAP